jgi:hypothetical protein
MVSAEGFLGAAVTLSAAILNGDFSKFLPYSVA